jgi:hypothetical protein
MEATERTGLGFLITWFLALETTPVFECVQVAVVCEIDGIGGGTG